MKDRRSNQLPPENVAKKAEKTTTIFGRIRELMVAPLFLAIIASGTWWLWNSLPTDEFFKHQAPPMTSAQEDAMNRIISAEFEKIQSAATRAVKNGKQELQQLNQTLGQRNQASDEYFDGVQVAIQKQWLERLRAKRDGRPHGSLGGLKTLSASP